MGTESPIGNIVAFIYHVEKMGPLRGDGKFEICVKYRAVCVEKMGPLRGDGNIYTVFNH